MQDEPQRLIVLDLDETLMHARKTPLAGCEAERFLSYYLYVRPGVPEFLAFCFRHFDVAVWSSASPLYGDEVIRRLFPSPSALVFAWFSDRCTLRTDPETGDMYWQKNLKKVRKLGYALERVLVVDDSPEKHLANYGNLVLVKPFEGDPQDDELPRLTQYLDRIKHAENYRKLEKRRWQRNLT